MSPETRVYETLSQVNCAIESVTFFCWNREVPRVAYTCMHAYVLASGQKHCIARKYTYTYIEHLSVLSYIWRWYVWYYPLTVRLCNKATVKQRIAITILSLIHI